MSLKKLSGRGFTLIEVLIVLFLVTLMASFLFATFNYILTDYAGMFEESKITQDAFNAMDIMSRDLKMASRDSSKLVFLWPDAVTTKYGGLSFYADLDNDGTAEEYTYYLYHPDEVMVGLPAANRDYLPQPSHDKFYRLYRYRGAPATVVTNYLGHPGVLLADDVVPPVVYERVSGSSFSLSGNLVQIRLGLHKEKETVVKEKIICETSIYPRNE